MNLTKLFRLPLRRRPKIFVSYRRDDSDTDADFLSERLARYFGEQQIFVDKDAIPIGKDFIETVEAAVASCDALLVIIGKQWLSASNGQGRRLDDPDDIVRFEIATALCRDILVIPVLVRGTTMPCSEELPDDLKKLARRHAFEISRAHRHEDVERLIVEIEKALAGQRAVGVLPHSSHTAAQTAPARGTLEASRINTKLAVGLSAVTLLIIMLGSLWLVPRSGAPIVSNVGVSQPPVSSPTPSPAPSSTPEQPKEATLQPSTIKGQQSIETVTNDTQAKDLQGILSPTPSPQPDIQPNEDEGSRKKGKKGADEPVYAESAPQSSPMPGPRLTTTPVSTWPSETQPSSDAIEILTESRRGGLQPLTGGEEWHPPSFPYSIPAHTPRIEINPVENYNTYLRLRDLLDFKGPPRPMPMPTPKHD
jgi:hypothetical protein